MNERIRRALETTDRGEFMPRESAPYEDRPQSIGFNTTISAPHMHAMTLTMLEERLTEGMKVLDIGSGSGYLTLLMAKMIGHGKVYGVDHITELVNESITNIGKTHEVLLHEGPLEIHMITRDGRLGLEEFGPFDVIHIGAATPEIPQPLLDQLANGGRLMVPLGPHNGF